MPHHEPIAIVGYAARLPGCGADLDLFWSNIASATDCAREVPAGRWTLPADRCVQPGAPRPDSVPHARGYYLDPFEAETDGLPFSREWLDELDPLFHLILDVGRRAWQSVASAANADRRNVGVILGNICLPTDSANALAREYLGGERPEQATHPYNRYVAGSPAGLLARALGLGGGTYTLDAACASSLFAVKLACDELLSGRADIMLAGGGSRPDCQYTQMGFAQLRALSATGRCSPFDAAADGLMVGEGAGIFILKRLADAERDGDPIAAVLPGWGLSNDTHGNLLAPAVEGQLRAMRSAYALAGWEPQQVDLIECHATGTPVGDAIEFESLRELWGKSGWKPGQCAIGSVKSTVGHLLTGAGAAALTKVLLAIAQQKRPPQANFAAPGGGMRYADGPFRVLTEAEEWQRRDQATPRRAAVSGFGFGGVNAHLLVEEYRPGASRPARLKSSPASSRSLSKKVESEGKIEECVPIAIVGVAAQAGPWSTTESFREHVLGGNHAHEAAPKTNGWSRAERPCPPGHYIEQLTVPLDRFRIPPKEIEEMLPQQLLMLQVATAALDDAKTGAADLDAKTGVFIGLGLDLNTTNFHLRWAAKAGYLQDRRSRTAGRHAPVKPTLDMSDENLPPPLTADRTMGALGSIAASRIARTFHFGGPSFTICSEETSSGTALDVAVRALRLGEISRAVVGGVDFVGDPRQLLATAALGRTVAPVASPLCSDSDGFLPAEGAAAVVLKSLPDAVRDGDRIYGVIRGVGRASGGDPTLPAADSPAYATSLIRACSDALVNPNTIEYLEAAASGADLDDRIEVDAASALLASTDRSVPLHIAAVQGRIGHTGAASVLVGLVRAAFALHHQILPPTVHTANLRDELAESKPHLRAAERPLFWLADEDSRRRVAVAGLGADGSSTHVVLEEYVGQHRIESTLPIGARPEALFVVAGNSPAELIARLNKLGTWLAHQPTRAIEYLARAWYRDVPTEPEHKLAVSFVSRSSSELADQVEYAANALRTRPDAPLPLPGQTDLRGAFRDRVFYNPSPLGRKAKLAFVYPGSGCHFPGMGRDLGPYWPEILRKQQAENQTLRSQYSPDHFWVDAIPEGTRAGQFLFGQVTLGTLVSDVLLAAGVKPDAVIGHSLGESSGHFGLRVWTDRDEMYQRICDSTLFQSDLAPPYNSARQHYGLSKREPLDWGCGLISVSADVVRSHLRPESRAYLLIINTPGECVVGGLKDDVQALIAAIGCQYMPLTGVTLAHCEAGKPVEQAYRALHTLPTTPPAGLKVYSGSWGRAYEVTSASAADSLTAGLLSTIDFPAAVEAAYRDGVRVFIEIGPGASCTRIIDAILGDRPHLARAACVPRQNGTSQILRVLARLCTERLPTDLRSLYGGPPAALGHREPEPANKAVVVVPVGLPPHHSPSRVTPLIIAPPAAVLNDATIRAQVDWSAVARSPVRNGAATPPESVFTRAAATADTQARAAETAQLSIDPPIEAMVNSAWIASLAPSVAASAAAQAALAEAHEVYLRVQYGYTQTAITTLEIHNELIRRLTGMTETSPLAPPPHDTLAHDRSGDRRGVNPGSATTIGTREHLAAPVPRSLSFLECTTFAVGQIGDVLGDSFAQVDTFPTRVRLPAGPLMLVDRVLKIEGEPRSMGAGRVVTDHTVHENRWYLDNGRCPTSVTVESGQADLFLSAFLGIDFQTRGLAVYRLLDAVVTFHRGLPRVGERIEYDIHIDGFFQQGDAWLFRFRFESTIEGVPLLSMRNGVAGFFTQAALAAGQGIIHTALDLQAMPGKRSVDWRELVLFEPCSLTAAQVAALHTGDLVAAFGPAFSAARLRNPMKLPSGMLRLVDRVPRLDPTGGRFGIGFVRAEYDIQPREWFIECHFIDDKVMPGTLMYECCLHTLRTLLMRFGWVAETGEAVCEPVPEIQSRLKCRGQVLETTRTVAYEVSVKEIGFRPEPYCIADALMYADGKPIVEISNLSLRMTGLSQERLEEIWEKSASAEMPSPVAEAAEDPRVPPAAVEEPIPLKPAPRQYDSASILAFSNGKPSEAFGEPYRIFDHDRVIARLPGPPYQFLDRVTSVTGEPFVLKAGASCVAEYDVPPGEWYFEANRGPRMPFSILLEIALQPCGWLAAYCGSALTSDIDLSFRNLGGSGTLHKVVDPDIGTLRTSVTLTKSSQSAGMLIQHYDMTVKAGEELVYQGTTYFGFFAREALANQVGMTQAKVPFLDEDQLAFADHGALPVDPPFPAPILRMIDRIDGYLPRGGVKGLGLVQGRISVDPTFWFFEAHFFQDPVWPGSLGIESFLQLLKYVAWRRWRSAPTGGWQTVSVHRPHSWTYRGQVLPTDKEVVVVLEVTEADDNARKLTANGFLTVDGRVIYQMTDFTLDCG